ncbi:MAG TPA: patatin-like phospholipase family protein, partial [Bacteroidales bacterium]|nr:patatin-like phospholipase family protein [Bacteroidales bacterium]
MKKKVSLVLSSGGARGVAHIGVIEELEKQGFEIKSIAGTSMGALVGGMYATGELNVYKEWMCSLDKM